MENFSAGRLFAELTATDGRRFSRGHGLDRRTVPGCGSSRSHAKSGPKSLPARNVEYRRARTADASTAARQFLIREKNQPHRGQSGPAPPHGSRFASAADVGRHALARLHYADADSGQRARSGNLSTSYGGSVVSQK